MQSVLHRAIRVKGARVDHVGEKEHGGAEQQCSEETCPGRKQITARAVDPGESQHAEEQRQCPDCNLTPADEIAPRWRAELAIRRSDAGRP